ncbi:MAG: hypothetical protein JO199_05570, partial [Candidatus Eremiobacteraeota bacterium]|nr:hypothetical protein [Candidatus Eremiobacteraeota bacterium]
MAVRIYALLACVAILATGCSSSSQPVGGAGVVPSIAEASAPRVTPLGKYIKHVVIIIQENRTFSNVFNGFPGADTVTKAKNSKGQTVQLRETPFVTNFNQDMIHNFAQAVTAWDNGKMDKFDETPFDDGQPAGSFAFSYLPRNEVTPYWSLAQQYVLADHLFPMEFGPSFTSHLALIAGNDNIGKNVAEANYPFSEPWGCDAQFPSATTTVNADRVLSFNGPHACFTQFKTLANVLDAGHVPWHYYAPPVSYSNGGQLWSTFDAIKAVRYGPDWANVLSPQTRILTDAQSGKLASMNWVVPDWADSDHPAANSDTGPSWVSSVVNAIGKGPDWKSTVVFVIWDDWGGWYDNVAPPQRDFRGNGMRVPLI